MDVSSLTTATQFAFVYPQTEKVFFGIGCAEVQLRKLLFERNYKSVLVVTSRSVRASPLIDRILRTIPNSVGSRVFSGSREHTPSACVARGAEIVAGARPDVIVVVGGGSAVDTAKGIALATAEGAVSDVAACIEEGRIEALPLDAPKLPIFAVPTTLSGSEFTATIGITSSGKRVKYVFRHPSLAPRVVMLDPSFAAHTPEALWAGTGLKLIDHCVERILAKNSNPLIDVQCAAALGLIVRHLAASIPPGADVAERRRPLLLALWFAQCLHGNVGVGFSHALAHQLGARSGVPHGVGSALLLPAVLAFNRGAAPERFELIAAALGDNRAGGDAASYVIARISRLIAELGLPRRLSDANVRREDLADIAEAALSDPSSKANPRDATVSQLTTLLEEIY